MENDVIGIFRSTTEGATSVPRVVSFLKIDCRRSLSATSCKMKIWTLSGNPSCLQRFSYLTFGPLTSLTYINLTVTLRESWTKGSSGVRPVNHGPD